MDVLIQCPYCNRALLRDVRDILAVETFWCSCHEKGFKVMLKLEVVKDVEDENTEDVEDINQGC
jgi:hypothetical protein